jgi:hypothetical protein
MSSCLESLSPTGDVLDEVVNEQRRQVLLQDSQLLRLWLGSELRAALHGHDDEWLILVGELLELEVA